MGMGMGYGGGGMMGGDGSYMMIMLVCCVCCVCVLSLVGGYWGNLFCGISKSLGRSCPADETQAPDPTLAPYDETQAPTVVTQPTCNSTYGFASRSKNDPRPMLRASSCVGTEGVPGRDCYMWVVDSDPVTGQARWVRLNDGEFDRKSSDPSCKTAVTCSTGGKIDFSKLTAYRDDAPGSLTKLCSATPDTANSRDATIRLVTQKAVAARINGWTSVNSGVWYAQVSKRLGQRDIAAIVNNVVRASEKVRGKLNRATLDKTTYAAMLEAALVTKYNEPDWIMTLTLLWTRTSRSKREADYVTSLNAAVRNKLTNWRTILDNPAYMR